jgi:hypothetical protein
MPKYMLCVSLSVDGLRGTMKEGGTARRKVRLRPGSLGKFVDP